MGRRISLIVLVALAVLWTPLVYLLHPGEMLEHVAMAIQVFFALFLLSFPVYLIGSVAQFIGERPDRLRNDRIRRGQCLQCGYDLHGNESGTCPECGVVVIEGVRETPITPGVSPGVFVLLCVIFFLIVVVFGRSC